MEVSLSLLSSFNVRSGLREEVVVVVVVEVFLLTLREALEPPEFMEDIVGIFLDLEEGAMKGFI